MGDVTGIDAVNIAGKEMSHGLFDKYLKCKRNAQTDAATVTILHRYL